MRFCSRRWAGTAPLHLLFLGETLGDDDVDGGLDESRGDALTGPIALAVIDQDRIVGGDVGLEIADGGQELSHVWIVRFETFRIELQVGYFVMGAIDVTMPEMPFDSAQDFKQVPSGQLIMVLEPLRELARDGDVESPRSGRPPFLKPNLVLPRNFQVVPYRNRQPSPMSRTARCK